MRISHTSKFVYLLKVIKFLNKKSTCKFGCDPVIKTKSFKKLFFPFSSFFSTRLQTLMAPWSFFLSILLYFPRPFLAHFMCLHMLSQVAGSQKSPPADITLIGSLSRVSLHVGRKIGWLRKFFTANTALIGLLTSVRTHVHPTGENINKRLTAYRAFIRLFTCVSADMH